MTDSGVTAPSQRVPNNLGPTLLITLGAAMLPLGFGVLVLLIGLAQLRRADGQLSLPGLRRWLPRVQMVQFWRRITL